MTEKIIFFLDILRILGVEIIGFFRNFFCQNPNQEKLFRLQQKDSFSKTLLIVSKTNFSFQVNIESLFAKYFHLNGYKVYFLTDFKERRAIRTFRAIGGNLIYHHFIYLKNAISFLFEELPEVKNSQELKNFSYRKINLGIGVYSSASRKLKVGRLDFSDKRTRKIVRKYLWRSVVYLKTADDILRKIKPDLVLAHEKGYIGTSEIFNLSVERGLNFIQWVGCQEPNSFVFKKYNKANLREHPFSLSLKTWNYFVKKPFEEKWEKEVFSSFERGYLSQDWFKYKKITNETRLIEKEEFIKKYKLDPNKKIAILFSHIMWDANLFYGKDLFEEGFEEWLIESVKAMLRNKNINWLIKIHPANKFKHDLEGIKDEYREIRAIRESFGEIPKGIKIIYPEDNINPYALFKFIDYGITVRGTIGMELPCFRIPVITAGSGRYSGKGFTVDPLSREEYLKILTHLEEIPLLTKKKQRLAIIYAYVLFRLRPLRFKSFQEVYIDNSQNIEIKINSIDEGEDFIKFVNWAINSNEEDFLNEIN